uniref:Uncharacterized protein n=1 Tax=Anguilla anguilla TaxID=7936 RepID=A0A0E9S246_ANGAN
MRKRHSLIRQENVQTLRRSRVFKPHEEDRHGKPAMHEKHAHLTKLIDRQDTSSIFK